MSDTKKAKVSKEVVYIDHDDEITSIIDKVEAAKHKVIAMVLPKRFATLQSVVNMRLLKRSADTAGKSVVLITSETALMPLAGAAGLHVAKNLQSKPEMPPSPLAAKELPDEPADPDEILDKDAKLDYHRSIGELAAKHEDDETETIALGAESAEAGSSGKAAKLPKDSKLKVPNFDRFRLFIGLGLAGLVAIIIFIILALTVLPKATVAIQTTSTPVSAELRLTASDKFKNLNEDKLEIPAELKKKDQTTSQQVQATGQKNQGQKATGKVVLRNCTDFKVTIPAGAGVISSGLTYITQAPTALDEGEFTSQQVCRNSGDHIRDVNVTAQSPGAKYNIGPSNFTVSGYSGVTGTSSAAMTGGTDTIITIVSQADLDNVKKKITSADSDKFSKEFEKQLSDEGFYVLSSTLKLADPVATSAPAVGQEAASVSVTIKLNYSVLVVPKADLEKLVKNALTAEIDKNKQQLSDNDVLKNAEISVTNQTTASSFDLEINVESTAIPIIDQQTLKKQIGGKKESEIKNIVSAWPGVRQVDVKMSPFWVSKAPKKPGKITVKLERAASSRN